MGRKTLVECDGCGKEELEDNTKSWIDAVFTVGRGGNETAICCSFACVGRYAVRREGEMNPGA